MGLFKIADLKKKKKKLNCTQPDNALNHHL